MLSNLRTYSGNFSGDTAVSSTKGNGFESPLTLISSPRPAALKAHACFCSAAVRAFIEAYERFFCFKARFILSIFASTSFISLPKNSTSKIASGSPSTKLCWFANPNDSLLLSRIILSTNSIADGPCSSIITVASIDLNKSAKCTTANPTCVGIGSNLTFAAVIVPKVPSDPTIILDIFTGPPSLRKSRLYPETLLCIFGYRKSSSF